MKFKKQLVEIEVIQLPNVVIITIGVEMVITPSTNVVKGGVLIRCTTNLGGGLGGVLVGRNLSWSSTLPTSTTGVLGTPQIVFTNPIMTTHVNRIADRPSMGSMVVRG